MANNMKMSGHGSWP